MSFLQVSAALITPEALALTLSLCAFMYVFFSPCYFSLCFSGMMIHHFHCKKEKQYLRNMNCKGGWGSEFREIRYSNMFPVSIVKCLRLNTWVFYILHRFGSSKTTSDRAMYLASGEHLYSYTTTWQMVTWRGSHGDHVMLQKARGTRELVL